jgi:hypothetical protein
LQALHLGPGKTALEGLRPVVAHARSSKFLTKNIQIIGNPESVRLVNCVAVKIQKCTWKRNRPDF